MDILNVTTANAQLIKYLYICRASARPPAFQSTAPHFPSSLDGMGNQKAQTGLIHRSAVIEHHPLNQTQPHFCVAKPQPIRGFPTIEPSTFQCRQ